MTKRPRAFDDAQLQLGLGVPEAATSDGALTALARESASAVAEILRRDPRNRYDVAASMSALIDDEVSKLMLDAYASEARDGHRISFDRMLVLVAATGRYDVLVGEEVFLAEIGHLEAQRRSIDSRLRALKSVAEPRKGGGRK